jgi:hypothetical protein
MAGGAASHALELVILLSSVSVPLRWDEVVAADPTIFRTGGRHDLWRFVACL